MTRPLSTPVQSAVAAPGAVVFQAVELLLDSGPFRVCNAGYDMTLPDGRAFLGIGHLGAVDGVEEGEGVQSFGVRLTLSGVDPDHIAVALGEPYQGRACNIYLCFLGADYAFLGDPVQVFSGRLDTMDVSIGNPAAITVTAESRLADLKRPRVRRYNHADQQAEHPDDMGLEFVAQMVEYQLLWGKS